MKEERTSLSFKSFVAFYVLCCRNLILFHGLDPKLCISHLENVVPFCGGDQATNVKTPI